MQGRFLGIDIGTSSVKALILDGRRVRSARSRPYGLFAGQQGQSEQDPRCWIDAVREAVGELAADVGLEGIDGIGLCGQMHALLPVDSTGEPVGSAMIWSDSRAWREARELEARLGPGYLRRVTGSVATANYPAAKIAWMKTHQPERLARARWVMGAKDWVRHVLGGEVGTEPTDGSGTGLMDLDRGQWDPVIVQAVGLNEHQLPPIASSTAVGGHLAPGWARELGLRAGTPLVSGAGDLPAALTFLGPDPGVVLVNVGSAGQVTQVLERGSRVPDAMQVLCHPEPGRIIAMAALLAAGMAVRWSDSVLTPDDPGAGRGGVLFLPQLEGERTPSFDPTPRGALVGLSLGTAARDLRVAVKDGVALQVRELVELILGTRVPERVLLGVEEVYGQEWVPRLAGALGREVEQLGWASPSAQGAALLAAIATGALSWAEVSLPSAERVRPDPTEVRRFQVLYRAYVEVATAVTRASRILAEIRLDGVAPD